MQKKGYDIQKNKRSITFKKDDHQVRDLRLGYRYTAAGIQESLEKQQKRKAQQAIVDQITEMRKQKKHLKPYPSVYISEYDEYGRRRSFFVRLLLTIRELVKQAGDEYYSEILEQQAPDNPYFMSVSRKLKLLDDALSTIDKYNLTDDDMLQQKLRELFQKNGICRSELYNLTNYLGNAVDLKEAIDRYENLLPILSQANLSPQDLVYVPDTETIRKNLAALNPMRPRTKSDLYQAVHDSPYRLTRKFHTISEEQAKKIILAIREKRTTGLPDGLTMRGRWHKESPELPAPHTPKCDLSSYDTDTRQALLAWKTAADQLAAYGLTTPESVRTFAADMQKKAAMRSDLQNTQAALNAEIQELYRLQHNLERFQKAPFVYGPLYGGNAEIMKKSLRDFTNDSQRSYPFLQQDSSHRF
jgi:hypothetical protein